MESIKIKKIFWRILLIPLVFAAIYLDFLIALIGATYDRLFYDGQICLEGYCIEYEGLTWFHEDDGEMWVFLNYSMSEGTRAFGFRYSDKAPNAGLCGDQVVQERWLRCRTKSGDEMYWYPEESGGLLYIPPEGYGAEDIGVIFNVNKDQ